MIRRAYFAGGCFWCITPVFREQNGVESVVCGFSGGTETNPSYEDVKHGRTHHRETICVTYEDGLISYDRLLEIFLWSVDPFDDGGQFIDRGASYTLALYPIGEEQTAAAEQAVRELEAEAGKRAAIAIEPFCCFFPAGEEHQNFDLKHPQRFAQEMQESGRADHLPAH